MAQHIGFVCVFVACVRYDAAIFAMIVCLLQCLLPLHHLWQKVMKNNTFEYIMGQDMVDLAGCK